MSGRIELLSHFGSRTIGQKIMAQGPSADTPFSRDQMAIEILGVIEVTIQGVHMAVNHIAGAVSIRISISANEVRGFSAQF